MTDREPFIISSEVSADIHVNCWYNEALLFWDPFILPQQIKKKEG